MFHKKEKIFYRRNLETGITASLAVVIVAFYFWPNQMETSKKGVPYFPEPIIQVIDIPSTEQSSSALPPRPQLPLISSMFEPIEDPEPLADVEIPLALLNEATGKAPSVSSGTLKKEAYEVSALPFIPRQILEVVPKKIEGIEGEIKVKLLIGTSGNVKEHKILNNSTRSELCLNNVIDAIYRSRWQPITIEGQKVEYWIEKTYRFN
jgi:outer membrane biosynthesis protein TonB